MTKGTAYLDQLIADGEAWARKVYFDEPRMKYLTPTFIIHYREGPLMIFAPWSNDDEKYAFVRQASREAKSRQATAVTFISETWSASYPKGDPMNQKPASRIDRLEGLQVCTTDGTTQRGKFWLILRDTNDYVEILSPNTRIDNTNLTFKILEDVL